MLQRGGTKVGALLLALLLGGCADQKYELHDNTDIDDVLRDSRNVVEGTVVESNHETDFLATALCYGLAESGQQWLVPPIANTFGYRWPEFTWNCRISVEKVLKGHESCTKLSVKKYHCINRPYWEAGNFEAHDRVILAYDSRFLDSFSRLRVVPLGSRHAFTK